MSFTTVSSDWLITIPKDMRERLSLKPGDRLQFVEEGKGVFKVFAANKDVRHLKGIVRKPERAASIQAMNRAVRKAGVAR